MRRDPLEIIEEIFRILEKEKEALTINQLAKLTGIHNVTIRKYLRIIQMIKQEPDIDIIETKHSIIIRMLRMKRRI